MSRVFFFFFFFFGVSRFVQFIFIYLLVSDVTSFNSFLKGGRCGESEGEICGNQIFKFYY